MQRRFLSPAHLGALLLAVSIGASLPATAQAAADAGTVRSEVRASTWLQREWSVMTTRAFLELQVPPGSDGEAIVTAVRDEFARINTVFSPWLADSELSRINRDAAQFPVRVSAEMFAMFAAADRFTRLTDGAFDASFASAGYLYDYRRHVAPDDAALAIAKPAMGWNHVELDDRTPAIRYLHAGTRVDFGGIAKGYAIDRAVAILRANGVRNGYVALGGDSFALGDHDGRPWQVGIRHPRDKSRAPVMVPASNLAISTSGDYERFFDRDGVRIHHILAPETGKPARGVVSVTIIADDSTTADALSTGVFVLGREKGLALVDRLAGISAIVIADDGKVYYSADLEPAAP